MRKLIVIALLVFGCQPTEAPVVTTAPVSWGVFGGIPPASILESGGPLEIASFDRISVGVYRIIYDVNTLDIGIVAVSGTALGYDLDGGQNVVDLVGVTQDVLAERLTLDVYVTTSIIDGVEPRLMDADTLFSIVVFSDFELAP